MLTDWYIHTDILILSGIFQILENKILEKIYNLYDKSGNLVVWKELEDGKCFPNLLDF